MAKIVGLEGLSGEQISEDLRNGARFVVFSWCVSLLIVTLKRGTDIYFIRPGESAALKSLPWTLLSFFAGWWGIPFGLIYTPWAIIQNLSGGKDVTAEVVSALRLPPATGGFG